MKRVEDRNHLIFLNISISALQMKVNGSFITEQEEVEVKKEKTFIWRPGKGT